MRLPEATKELRGTSRADRKHPPSTVERLTTNPAAPKHLSAGAAAEWRKLAPLLVKAGTLTRADLRALELLAETLASAAEFAGVIARDGTLIDGAGGSKKAHPALQALATARAQARQLLSDFGLTPRGRSGIEPAPPGKSTAPDPLDEFAP